MLLNVLQSSICKPYSKHIECSKKEQILVHSNCLQVTCLAANFNKTIDQFGRGCECWCTIIRAFS